MELSFNRVLSALEDLEIDILNLRRGKKLTNEQINAFVIRCGWLPQNLKEDGLSVAAAISERPSDDHSQLSELKAFHNNIAKYKQKFVVY